MEKFWEFLRNLENVECPIEIAVLLFILSLHLRTSIMMLIFTSPTGRRSVKKFSPCSGNFCRSFWSWLAVCYWDKPEKYGKNSVLSYCLCLMIISCVQLVRNCRNTKLKSLLEIDLHSTSWCTCREEMVYVLLKQWRCTFTKMTENQPFNKFSYAFNL